MEEAPVEQHPVERKYLRKRQNGRRKPVIVADTTEETKEKVTVDQVTAGQAGK